MYAVHRTLLGHEGGVLCVNVSNNGAYCMSGGQDRKIMLWNVDSGKRVTVFDGHGQSVRDLQCSKDSASLVSVSQDKTLLCWDVARVTISRKIRAHDADVNCVRMDAESNVAVTGGADKKVHVWDLRSRSNAAMQTFAEATDGVTSLSVSPYEIMATSLDGNVRQYDLRAGKLRIDNVGPSVMCGAYSNDFNCVLVSTLDSRLRLFDKKEGELLNEFRGHVNEQYRTQSCFSNDDSLVISGSEDHHVYVWDLLEAELRATLKGHTHVVACVVYSPMEQVICSGSIDRSVIVWKRAMEFERR